METKPHNDGPDGDWSEPNGGERPSGGTPPDADAGSMAKSVTRHAPVTGPRDFRFLSCGIDTLDLSIYVQWGQAYDDLFMRLESKRKEATGVDHVLWKETGLGPCLVWATGKKRYRFHLQVRDFHIFIAAQAKAEGMPNVLASISARLLWSEGATRATEAVRRWLVELGGRVERIVPNRCDFAADFVIPDGVSFDFLREMRVCKSRRLRPFLDGEKLETCYLGASTGKIQARIYDKGLEVLRKGDKLWFLEVWDIENPVGVWRVEFQLRRELLKQYRIESVAELLERASAIWQYLTDDWLSFRLLDDENTSRRTVHPWWQAVANCVRLIGPESDVQRNLRSDTQADHDWYRRHIAGCLLGYATKKGVPNLDTAIESIASDVWDYWKSRDWESEYEVRRLRLGRDGRGADDDEAGEDDAHVPI